MQIENKRKNREEEEEKEILYCIDDDTKWL